MPASASFDSASGRLYVTADDHETMLLPWAEMLAFRRTLSGGPWRRCTPEVSLRRETGELVALVGGSKDASIQRYAERIPNHVRDVVIPYRPQHHWSMLSWCATIGPAAGELMASNAALAFLLAHEAAFDGPTRRSRHDPRPLVVVYRQRRDLVGLFRFPAAERTLRILRKIRPEAVDVQPLKDLRQRLRQGSTAERLAHLPSIGSGVLSIVSCGGLPMLTPRLLACIASASDDQAEDAAATVADTLRMWQQVHRRRKPPVFDSLDRLAEVHDELARQVPEVIVPATVHRSRVTRPQGTDTIVLLKTVDDLVEEALQQHNCVASYGHRVLTGRIAIYRVLAPERCTLSLKRVRGEWRIDQLKAAHNAPPAPDTRTAIDAWLATAR